MRAPVLTLMILAGMIVWSGSHGTAQTRPVRAASADWRTPEASKGTLTLDRGWQGHFFVNGDIDGAPIRFLVDTGASTVALNRADARAAGVNVATLVFDQTVTTASGTVHAASTTLPAVRIGDIQILDVPAAVLDVDSGIPLLGESFLARVDRVAIEGDRMTLTKL